MNDVPGSGNPAIALSSSGSQGGIDMKLRTEVIIDADRRTVWRLFDNPDNMPRWQPTLKSFKRVEGEAGQPGAVSELIYDENGREIRMIECVTERREPDFMAGSYASDFGTAIIVNHFEEVSDDQTRWVAYWNYTFKGFFRLLSPFFRRSMQKRLDDDLQRFKLFVESELA